MEILIWNNGECGSADGQVRFYDIGSLEREDAEKECRRIAKRMGELDGFVVAFVRAAPRDWRDRTDLTELVKRREKRRRRRLEASYQFCAGCRRRSSPVSYPTLVGPLCGYHLRFLTSALWRSHTLEGVFEEALREAVRQVSGLDPITDGDAP